MTLLRKLGRDVGDRNQNAFPLPLPCIWFLRSISEPKVILLELKPANAVFLAKETVKGSGGFWPEAWELFSSRAGGLGLLNPHQPCFHCSRVSVCFVFFSPQCLFVAFSVPASVWLSFLILHTDFVTSLIGIRRQQSIFSVT